MKLHALMFAAALVVSPVLAVAKPVDLDLDTVLAKHYEARGGMDAIKAMNSYRATGEMNMAGMQAPMHTEAKRPGKLRTEFTIQGMTGIQAVDGDTGWQIMPFMGKNEAEPMSEEELRNFKNQADIEGPLVDWKSKGHTVELVGTEEVEGADAYKLKINLKSGDEITAWIDAEFFLDLKWDITTTMRGQPIKISVSFGDYKKVGDLTLPFSMAQTMEGIPGGQNITIKNYELNVDLPDERFKMPAKTEVAKPASE